MGEIDASVEKCAHGEFSGLGETRAAGQGQFDYVTQNYRRSVSRDFDDVIGGVGMGFGEVGDDNFVDALVWLVWRGRPRP